MVDSTTTNYGWTKPTVGADENTWGGLINGDLDSIDTDLKAVSDVADGAVPKAGGTMTGALTNSSGFVGPLTGTASNATLAATASTVTNGVITPAKLSTGGPSWDGAGNVSATSGFAAPHLQAGSGGVTVNNDTNFTLNFASGNTCVLTCDSDASFAYNRSTKKFEFFVGNTLVGTVDSTGFVNQV